MTSILDQMDEHDRASFAACKECCRRIGNDSHWHDWTLIGVGLIALRRVIMRELHVPTPKGAAYNRAFGDACRSDEDLARIPSDVRAHLLYCMEHPEVVARLRAEMKPADRLRINHPSGMAKRVRAARDPTQGRRNAPSHVARLKGQLEDMARVNHDLREELAASEARDGSLFDLRKDSVEDIAQVIVSHCREHRAKEIAAKINQLLRVKSARKSAGTLPTHAPAG